MSTASFGIAESQETKVGDRASCAGNVSRIHDILSSKTPYSHQPTSIRSIKWWLLPRKHSPIHLFLAFNVIPLRWVEVAVDSGVVTSLPDWSELKKGQDVSLEHNLDWFQKASRLGSEHWHLGPTVRSQFWIVSSPPWFLLVVVSDIIRK